MVWFFSALLSLFLLFSALRLHHQSQYRQADGEGEGLEIINYCPEPELEGINIQYPLLRGLIDNYQQLKTLYT